MVPAARLTGARLLASFGLSIGAIAAQIAPPGESTAADTPAQAEAPKLTGLWPAPAGCWVCADGSLARSRATDTPLGRGRLERLQRFELPAPLTEEVLVSGSYGLALTSAGGQHFGQWFDLPTGRAIGAALEAGEPLAPCLAGNRAVLRLGPNQLVGGEIGPQGWKAICAWSIEAAGEPLFDGEQVYVRDARGIVHLAWGRPKPLARIDLELIGRLAWLPDSIVALARSSSGGNFHVVQVPFDLSGPTFGQAVLPIDAVDHGERPARLFPGALKHYLESAHIGWNGTPFAWLAVGPSNGLIDGALVLDVFCSGLIGPPAQCRQGSLGWVRDEGWKRDYLDLCAVGDLMMVNGPTVEFQQRGPRSVAVASDGVWIDQRAIDLHGRSLVQLLPGAPPRWVVPTAFGPLICRENQSFELWGPARGALGAQRPPIQTWPAELSDPAALDDPQAVVLGDPDGPVLTGPFRLAEGRLSVREPEQPKRKSNSKPAPGLLPEQLSLWIAGDGKLRLANALPVFERGLFERLRLLAAAALAEGSLPAQQSFDPAVIARALALAREFELETEREKLAAAAERVEHQGRKARADRVEAAATALDRFDSQRLELVERAFDGLIGPLPDALGWEALRTALERPDSREFARRFIDHSLPAGLDSSLGSSESRLELARLHARRGVAMVGVEGGLKAPKGSPLADELARVRWQKGWIGLLSPDLFVFGIPERFDTLVQVLQQGQLLADLLAQCVGSPPRALDPSLFESAPADRPRRLLSVWVLGAPGDAQKFEARRAMHRPLFRGGDRALYDPSPGLTLVHWPLGSVEVNGQEADLSQALTEHWLDLRCPLYTDTLKARGGPGYWARVGLPLMAAELSFDLERDRVALDQGRSRTALLLAGLDPGLWLPWERLLSATASLIEADSKEPVANVDAPWLLNRTWLVTTREVYWAQSAQLCGALLFDAGQQHRAEFARVLGAYHRGDAAAARLINERGLGVEALERLMLEHRQDLPVSR